MSTFVQTLVVASSNPIKLRAAENGFRRMFPTITMNVLSAMVASGVRAQPLSDAETLGGALQRVENAVALVPDADYWVGIEGGIEDLGVDMIAFAWVVVRSRQLLGKGRTGTFFLPPAVAELVRAGKELGEADDLVFNRSNSKQDVGAVGLLTNNVIERVHLYEHATILALIPFMNEALYNASGDHRS
jgi:inosine/xanthosine triphosphatase